MVRPAPSISLIWLTFTPALLLAHRIWDGPILTVHSKCWDALTRAIYGVAIYWFSSIADYCRLGSLNVSPCRISPVSYPFLNQYARCSEVPCVKASGETWPC